MDNRCIKWLHVPAGTLFWRVEIQLQRQKLDLGNLRLLDLSHSFELTRVPDLSSVPNLEFLRLSRCLSLIEIPSSIGELKCLKELNLSVCSKLHSIPRSICNLKSLTLLDISCCRNVNGLPENIGNLELLQKLEISSSRIKALPSSINQLKNLASLVCSGCEGLTLPPLTEHEVKDGTATFLEFRNCINLEKEKVMEDVLETHLLKDEIVELCIPGDEVPQRMRYKNQSGSSISFTLDKPNLIGVSLCLVFYPKNHYVSPGLLFVADSALEAFVCNFSAEFAAALSTFICCLL
ncbi:hypothetical protein GH714_019200 [Hevea brasiliensis]|uniref:Uncharacterized protein n=1 Tax=Hevea brasiliensis TaxID=3981 RepID=A0A6A6N296_HEVBR|nr:hypothetical protein GH714_019200 [Hevea brasiliensis]